MDDILTIGVSARGLFDLDESMDVWTEEGPDAYVDHHRNRENIPLPPGPAYPLVAKLLSLNEITVREKMVEVIIISGLHPDAGLRVMKSLDHYGLKIDKAAFTGGGDAVSYIGPFDVDLFLSQSADDVQRASDLGHAAAFMYQPPSNLTEGEKGPVRIAFDGDAVLFSAESELIYKQSGLAAFKKHEQEKAHLPLPEGPFAKVFRTISKLRNRNKGSQDLFRISLVTMRSGEARERAMRTFRSWGVQVDEAYFLGNVAKANVLQALKPHIFFDDQDVHLRHSRAFAPVAKVPYQSDDCGMQLSQLVPA